MDWNLRTYSGVVYNGYLWFSNNSFNGLFRMDTNSMRIELVDFFPGVDFFGICTHKKCILCGDKLIFLPASSDYLHIYDTTNGSFDAILFNESRVDIKKDRVSDAVLVGEDLYIFSWLEGDPLFIFNVVDHSLKRCTEFDDQIKNIAGKGNYLCTRCDINNSHEIFFGIWNTDILAKWDIEDKKLRLTNTGIEQIFSANVIDDDIWIIPINKRAIYKIDRNNNVLEYKLKDFNTTVDRRQFNRISSLNDLVFGVPAFSGDMFVISGDSIIIPDGVEWSFAYPDVPAFFSDVIVNGKVWLLPFATDKMLIYDRESNCLDATDFCLKDSFSKKRILERGYDKWFFGDIAYETDSFSLSDFTLL